MKDQEKIAIAREYFIRGDQGRADLMDLLHDDAEIYYPKFGFGKGRESLFDMVKGFEGSLEFLQHDYDRLHFIPAGDFVVAGRQVPRTGGIIIARGKNRGAIERIMKQDPFLKGRLASLDIVEFTPSGDFTGFVGGQ